MADLDAYKDKVIAFEAVKASDTSRLVTRQPLRPINSQELPASRGSSCKSVGIQPSFDGSSDENHAAPSAMSDDSLHSSGAMHGQPLQLGTQSDINSHSPSPDPISQAPRSHSNTPGSTFGSSTFPLPWIQSGLTPNLGATTPLSTSDHSGGSVNMAGFECYYASWRDRIQVSYPDYDDGTYNLVF